MDKAPDAFRTISEVADEIDVPQHVLRFWESRFPQIKPMKRGGGRRYYRPDDVDLLRGVRHLLYGEGYTIRGVQRILREEGADFVQEVWRGAVTAPPPLEADADEIEAIEVADEREGDAYDEHGAPDAPASPRTEPNLLAVGLALSAEAVRSPVERPATVERREPVLVAPEPASSAPPAVLPPERRRQLEIALDELLACRALLTGSLEKPVP